ncbi:hypothetical protein FE257_001058 [Aspergillus nanangensis]|uniref:glutathione transferase n=1 Tax=Aspergillus nanangensis TaxID=2582783 RepID=A0AAD4CU89_ASPNN|nr:hypothetical protein FE257_001058 [Aspergillus nanangensis]
MMTSTTENPKIVLHWLEQSRSQRILWLLEELNVDYELKTYKRNKLTNLAGSQLKSIHPLGKFPVIEIYFAGQDEPVVLAESGAIVEYLIEISNNPTMSLQDRENQSTTGVQKAKFLRLKYFLHYAEGSIMNVLLIAVMITFLRTSRVFLLVRPLAKAIAWQLDQQYVKPSLSDHLSFLNNQVVTSDGGFLCGENLTGADIMMAFPLEVLKARGNLEPQTYPELTTYLERLQQRDAYRRAAQKISDQTGKTSDVVL